MRVVVAEYPHAYKLKITFGNKKIKIVDLEPMLKQTNGIFLSLKRLEFFKQVQQDDCQLGICWPNGADICPDFLYAMGQSE